MKEPSGSIRRRWAFYSGGRLAFAGWARQTGPSELRSEFFETEHHVSTVSLPERLQVEQLIRESVSDDVRRALGCGWTLSVRFMAPRLSDCRLAEFVFGDSRAGAASGG